MLVVLHVVGARPNFMKAAPVMTALSSRRMIEQILVHTGQHYDSAMSDIFFRDLGLPRPDLNLEVGSGTHAFQTAQVMMKFEEAILANPPGIVLVYGDVNSTVAATLVCAKLQIPVGHVEAGLRSFDRGMPEEINRIVTDQLADLLFTPSPDGNENLEREGISSTKVHLVGNVMIDTLVKLLPLASERWHNGSLPGWKDRQYGLVTLHRPSNVDDSEKLGRLVRALAEISSDIPLIFPIHPRTRERVRDLASLPDSLKVVAPLGYLDFLALQTRAKFIITDSGGVQEETTFLGVPCLTLRSNTERPVTAAVGTNVLVGEDINNLKIAIIQILEGSAKVGKIPPLWDGHASDRIADVIQEWHRSRI